MRLWLAKVIKGFIKDRRERGRRYKKDLRHRARPQLELLEDRRVPSVATAQHELLLSVDGLHNADLSDPQLGPVLTNIENLQDAGVTYTNAHTTSPSDSFPGTLSYLTGAGPGTTGVFYDDSYSRTLLAPGSSSNAQPGTEVTYFEAIDKNSALLSGGGNFDASSIDPSLLPIDPTTNQVVYPNQFLQVNTIFDVAHQAGLYTAFSDKHPAYQIADGNNPQAINDLYTPEINSTTALLNNATGRTVNADALLNDTTPPAQGLSIAPGYNASVFAVGPSGATQPDSITVDGLNVYVGYNNGAAKDGSSGSSTIAQFTPTGAKGTWMVAQTWSIPGHNDGLKVDPNTHLLWALQNEDANPTLVVIDPATAKTTQYTIKSVNSGGGFDDIAFTGGKVFLTASNPTNNPNTDPAVVQVTLNGSTAITTPVLFGNATALNLVTHQMVTLNLQDPDSMTVDPHGNLLFTDQADNQLVTVLAPGTAKQSVTVLPLSDAAKNPVSVDDTLFNPGSTGEILVTDQTTGILYQVTVPGGSSAQVFSAAQDIGELGTTNLATGLFTPVLSGLGSPRGLAFLNAGAFTDLSNFTLVDPSTDPQGANDPNLINDTTKNVLLTEKYDDLKVQAILNEINGLPSHTFFGSDKSKIPAIFGMNFQGVSVAEKDAHGGINLLPNGQEGTPSALLEGAIQHTDQSIGKMVAALHQAGIWDTTQVYVTAKHGQDPRVGLAGLMKDSTLPNLLSQAGAPVAQATQDNVSLLWLQDQATTGKAVTALRQLQQTGTLNVFFQGVAQTLPASQVIDQILSGKDLVKAGLGNPATDSTTPDIIVTLKPGYIWVGNVNNQHKRAEHGGFTEDSTHIALVVGGGALPKDVQGTTVDTPVKTQQIAVSVLEALGLNSSKLQGAVIDHTEALPDLSKPSSQGKNEAGLARQFTASESGKAVAATHFDSSNTNGLPGNTGTIPGGDASGRYVDATLVRDLSGPPLSEGSGRSDNTKGVDQGTVHMPTPSDATLKGASTAMLSGSVNGQASPILADEVDLLFANWSDLFGGNGDLKL
jgi:arylsulfatase A-like enzyme